MKLWINLFWISIFRQSIVWLQDLVYPDAKRIHTLPAGSWSSARTESLHCTAKIEELDLLLMHNLTYSNYWWWMWTMWRKMISIYRSVCDCLNTYGHVHVCASMFLHANEVKTYYSLCSCLYLFFSPPVALELMTMSDCDAGISLQSPIYILYLDMPLYWGPMWKARLD